MDYEPIHIRIRREYLKNKRGQLTCRDCHGSGYLVNSAEEYLVEQCGCVTDPKRPFIGDGRTICNICNNEYFKHKPALMQIRDHSSCLSIIVHCNGKPIQI